MKLFHASNRKFTKFDMEYAGSIEDHAKNSMLGLWFAPGNQDNHPSWIEDGFISKEGYIYIVDVDISQQKTISIGELRKMHSNDNADNPFYWKNIRQEFLNDGYTCLALQEKDNNISMYIVLDHEKIRILNRVYIKDKNQKYKPCNQDFSI